MGAAQEYEFVMPIRWGDMDAMGHVNNTIYFRYFEQARIAWIDAVVGRPEEGEFGPTLASVSCDFIKPLVYPGELLVRQRITQLGRSSVHMDLEIRRRDQPDTVYARGKSVIVWMDYGAGRSAPWPANVRLLMEPESAD